MLPVNTTITKPAWTWDGNLETPTVSPSILTKGERKGVTFVCHSYLKAGVFEFLTDCTHALVGQKVLIPDLPDWVLREDNKMTEEDQAAKDAAGITGEPGKDLSAEAEAADAQTRENASPASTGEDAAPGTRHNPEDRSVETLGDISAGEKAEDATTE